MIWKWAEATWIVSETKELPLISQRRYQGVRRDTQFRTAYLSISESTMNTRFDEPLEESAKGNDMSAVIFENSSFLATIGTRETPKASSNSQD